MGTISVSLPSDGETIDAADYNTPVNTIVNEINGNLDNANIASDAAIDGSKLADNSIDISTKASSFDGWVEVTDSWTYASATTVTVPTDATAKYSVGDRVQFNQSGVKYFQVTAVAATTLTLFGIGGATVANAAISDIKYSKVGSPVGYSQAWQSWTPTFNNFTVGNGTVTAAYIQIGKTVFGRIHVVAGSTTAFGTTSTIDPPVTPASFYTTAARFHGVGNASYHDAGTNVVFGNLFFDYISASGKMIMNVFSAGGTYAARVATTASVPFTLAAADTLGFDFRYEAA